jgi:hypothetical protein
MTPTHDEPKYKDHIPSPEPRERPATLERTEDEERIHRHKDDLLDKGVEETFPASDPVAVKHIT